MKLKSILKVTALISASAALAITLINDKKQQSEKEEQGLESSEEYSTQ